MYRYSQLHYRDLLNLIRNEGDYLLRMHPTEFIVRNILHATLKVVREEAQRIAYGEEEQLFDSLNVRFNILDTFMFAISLFFSAYGLKHATPS